MRETAIRCGVVNPRTKKSYDENSDVRTLVASFLRRCEKRGVVLIWQNGRKLSLAEGALSAHHLALRFLCCFVCITIVVYLVFVFECNTRSCDP